MREKTCIPFHLLHPKKGGRLHAKEYSQTPTRIIRAFFFDITRTEARGFVMTKYLSKAITIKVIIDVMPKRAPQKAYSSQPFNEDDRSSSEINLPMLIYFWEVQVYVSYQLMSSGIHKAMELQFCSSCNAISKQLFILLIVLSMEINFKDFICFDCWRQQYLIYFHSLTYDVPSGNLSAVPCLV